jgi:hypothetical protein
MTRRDREVDADAVAIAVRQPAGWAHGYVFQLSAAGVQTTACCTTTTT